MLILLAVVILVALYIFNLNLKPLNFPKGPLSLPLVGSLYVLGKEPHKKLLSLKKKYGKVFRIDFGGLRGIILADPQAVKDAFGLHSFSDRPIFEVVTHIRGEEYNSGLGLGLVWARGKVYDEQRRFAIKNLKSFGFGKSSMEGDILKHLKDFFNTFDKKIAKPIINQHIFTTLPIKALWKIVTGENAKDDDVEFEDTVDAVKTAISSASSAGGTFFFPSLCKLFPELSGWDVLIKGLNRVNILAAKAVEAHKKSSYVGEPRDFIGAYLQKIHSTTQEHSSFFGKKAQDNLEAVIGDLFVTGTESISTALTWTLLLLVLHPEVQEKIQKEIDTVIGKDRLPSMDDRHAMLYTECFILEVLRYSGFVPLASPHITSEDVNFYGYFIPKGTIVVPNIYGVLHDPDYWDDPDTFLPERFLTEDGTSTDKNKAYLCSFIFGSGKRGCIGENLAREELFLFITGLCQRYTFKENPTQKPTVEANLGTTLVPKPHSMIVCRR